MSLRILYKLLNYGSRKHYNSLSWRNGANTSLIIRFAFSTSKRLMNACILRRVLHVK